MELFMSQMPKDVRAVLPRLNAVEEKIGLGTDEGNSLAGELEDVKDRVQQIEETNIRQDEDHEKITVDVTTVKDSVRILSEDTQKSIDKIDETIQSMSASADILLRVSESHASQILLLISQDVNISEQLKKFGDKLDAIQLELKGVKEQMATTPTFDLTPVVERVGLLEDGVKTLTENLSKVSGQIAALVSVSDSAIIVDPTEVIAGVKTEFPVTLYPNKNTGKRVTLTFTPDEDITELEYYDNDLLTFLPLNERTDIFLKMEMMRLRVTSSTEGTKRIRMVAMERVDGWDVPVFDFGIVAVVYPADTTPMSQS